MLNERVFNSRVIVSLLGLAIVAAMVVFGKLIGF